MSKKILVLFVGAFVASLFLFSCKQKAGGSGEAYTLKMRLNKGDKFSQDMDMDMNMNMAVMGQAMDMKMGMKGGALFEVVNDSSGTKDLSMTYTSMKMKMEMMGSPEAESINTDAMSDKISEKISGKKVILKINDKYEIVDVSGFNEMMLDDSTDIQTREQMKKMFSKDQMNSMFGMMFQLYPDKPVRVGETWEKENEVNVTGISMKMTGKYTLTEVKDGIAHISVDGKFSGKGNMDQGGMAVEMDMDGGQKGTMSIGLADGYLRDGNITMDVKADMNMMGQKVPMTIKGRYKITGK